jgi:hypothetical protein
VVVSLDGLEHCDLTWLTNGTCTWQRVGVYLWMDSIWPSVITWHMPSLTPFTMCNRITKLVAPPSFVVWFLLHLANCRFQSIWYHIKKRIENEPW